MNERCSAVLLNKLPSKEKDPRIFTIPCDIGYLHIKNDLAYLGASISLMPCTMYEKLGLGEAKPTRMSLELADRSIQYLRGIAENVLIKIDKFILPIDFVILDMREDSKIPIILGRPFLATVRAMIDVFNKKIMLRVGNKEELLEDDQLDSFLVNNLEESINISIADDIVESRICIQCIKEVNTPYSRETIRTNKAQNEHLYSASANEIDEKRPTLKDLPSQLEYAYLKGDESCPLIISSKLTEKEKVSLFRGSRRTKNRWEIQTIYYVSKTLNDAQAHYTTTEKELLDAKPRLIRWVLLLQGFNFEFKDKKGAENLAVDHLLRLENPNIEELAYYEITDKFLNEHLMILKAKLNDEELRYADYVNYIVKKIAPPKWTSKRRKWLFSQVRNYFWDKPYAFRLCPDNVMRRCVDGNKIIKILTHFHSGPTRGHHSASITRRKVYKAGFYWPSIFKDAKDYVMKCDACQKSGNISS
ncbi:reverse transcriptase domain-containing protein [Tanacetum coccineum]